MVSITKGRGDASKLEAADMAVVEAADERKHHPAARAVRAIGHLGDQPPMLALSATLLLSGWRDGDRRLMRAGARMVASELVTIAIKDLVKRAVTRTRPHLLRDEGRYEVRTGGPHEGEYNSFPSGHTAGAVAVARALVREYPEAAVPAYGFATAVAAGQIPECAHYPTDVAAGALIGLASEVIVDHVVGAIDAALEV